jgi:hypothetical protein
VTRTDAPHAPKPLRIGRRQTPAQIRDTVVLFLGGGTVHAAGRDCRTLQRLVIAAGLEGLELRDHHGFLLVAAQRLRRARGVKPEHKRLPLRWSVELDRSDTTIPDDLAYVVKRHRGNESARLIVFRPGTLLYLGDTRPSDLL